MESIFTSSELLQFLRKKFANSQNRSDLGTKENESDNEKENSLNKGFFINDNLTHQLNTYFHAVQKPFQPDLSMLIIWMEFLCLMEQMTLKSAQRTNELLSGMDFINEIVKDSLIMNDLKEIRLYYHTLLQQYYKFEFFWEKALCFFRKFFQDKLPKFKNESLDFVEMRNFPEKEKIIAILRNEGKTSDHIDKSQEISSDSPLKKKTKLASDFFSPIKYPDTPSSIANYLPISRNKTSETCQTKSSSPLKIEYLSPFQDKNNEEKTLSRTEKPISRNLHKPQNSKPSMKNIPLYSISFEKTESVTETMNRALLEYLKDEKNKNDEILEESIHKSHFKIPLTGVQNLQIHESTQKYTKCQRTDTATENIITVDGTKYYLLKTIGRGGSSVVHLIANIHDPNQQHVCKTISYISESKILNSYLNEIGLMVKMKGINEMVQIHGFEIKQGNIPIFGYNFEDENMDLHTDSRAQKSLNSELGYKSNDSSNVAVFGSNPGLGKAAPVNMSIGGDDHFHAHKSDFQRANLNEHIADRHRNTHKTSSDIGRIESYNPEYKTIVEHITRCLSEIRFVQGSTYTINIIMERGHTDLSKYLKKEKFDHLVLFQKILRIMTKLYDLRIIHADIKPANLILLNDKNGDITVKLIDFGISRETPSNTTSLIQDERVGTLNYICPEKMQTNEGKVQNGHSNKKGTSIRYNRSSDVWSFGMIIYEMVFGCDLFTSLGLKDFVKKLRWLQNGHLQFCECVKKINYFFTHLRPLNHLHFRMQSDTFKRNLDMNKSKTYHSRYNPVRSKKESDISQSHISGDITDMRNSDRSRNELDISRSLISRGNSDIPILLFDPTIHIIANTYHPSCSSNCYISPSFTDKQFLVSIIQACLVHSPDQRISVKEIEQYLKEYLERRVVITR